MTHHDERFDDAAAAYLLRAMPEEERVAFEAHLEGCAACRAEVEDLRVAADALPASPVQLTPPPELKDRIMSVVNAEAELLRAAGPRADAPPVAAARRRGRWALRPRLALAGALALLVIGAIAGAAVRGGSDGTRTVVAQLAPQGAKVSLIVRGSGHSTLVARGMPSAGRGRFYQVWLQRGERAPEPTNALFETRPDGSASVDVPGSLDGVDHVLVTSEPDGGSRTPSRPPVLSVVPS